MLKLRQYDDLDDLEKMALIRMSYSRFNTFDLCEAMYFHQYIAKEDSVFGAAAVTGNIVHSVLEDNVGTDLEFEKIIASFDEHRIQYDPEMKIDDALIEAGHEMLGEFVDRHAGETFNIIGKEQSFQLIIGSALIIGFIDLVTRDANGLLRITDYKSGKWQVANKDVPDNLQLGIYALAMSQLYPGEDVYAELYYLRDGKRKGHLFKPGDLEDVYTRVLAKVNKIINNLNFTPVDGKGRLPCSFCDFAKPDICKIGAIRKERMTQWRRR